MWALRSASASGISAHMLVASPAGEHFAGRSVRRRYVEARLRSIERALARRCIDTAGDLRQVLRALQAGDAVFAVVDVPADQVGASKPVTVLGMPARLPTALLRLAVDRQIPVHAFTAGLRTEDGDRIVRVHALGVPTSVDALADRLAQLLGETISEDAPQWHFWSEADRFFRA